jgi:hypothetical protein
MKKIDQGFGAIGLLILAVVLSCLLVTAVPVIRSEPPAHTSDWLGFAGGVVGGLMTMIAAGFAWIAVQRQIRAQTDIAESQNAIQRYNIVSATLDSLEDEDQLLGELALAARIAAATMNPYRAAGIPFVGWQAHHAKSAIEENRKKLEVSYSNFQRASKNKAMFQGGLLLRANINVAISEFNISIVNALGTLNMASVKNKDEKIIIAEPEQTELQQIDFSREIAKVDQEANAYKAFLRQERIRLNNLAKAIRARHAF